MDRLCAGPPGKKLAWHVAWDSGIVIAVLTYLWTRRRTSLAYVYLGEHLLGSASDALPPEIVVQYNGISIPRLTKSILILWNSGENTINGEDIVAKDPLRFHVGGDGRNLAAVILKSTRAVNDFSILKPPDGDVSEMEFTFNFLDKNDGVVVEVLHTSADRKPSIKGTLKGLPQGFRNLGQFTRPKPLKKTSGKLRSITWILSPPVMAVEASSPLSTDHDQHFSLPIQTAGFSSTRFWAHSWVCGSTTGFGQGVSTPRVSTPKLSSKPYGHSPAHGAKFAPAHGSS